MPYPPYHTIGGTNIQVLAPEDNLDFFDTQSIELPRKISSIDAWNIVMSRPMPIIKIAFKIRDAISSRFGIKPILGFSINRPKSLSIGDKLDFFLVEHVTSNILTLTSRDRHLDVMTCVTTANNRLSITSSVKVHNTFGHFYMLPVAPAHKLIVRNMLKKIGRELSSTKHD